MKKTIYKKFYNRSLPLMSVEEWYQGEHVVLPKSFSKKIYFNHLFVYRFGKGTDVYYDQSSGDSAVKELITYFKKNPKRLNKLAKQYEKDSENILNFCKNATINNIKKLRRIIINKIWPMIVVTMVLGYFSKDLGDIGKLGLKLRKKYDTLIYKAGWKLWELSKQKLFNKKKYLDYLTFKEIKTGKLPSIQELEKRKQGYIYFSGRLFVGKTLQEFIKARKIELTNEIAEFKGNAIRGTIAMTGKVVGKVKLVFEIPQLENVKQGDILVTSMTVPDFLPAMKRAAAFVTDEGGITCHAAIVAREMKKPCIIGTKIATKVLKNGDLVEVDANNGVVRIIKQ